MPMTIAAADSLTNVTQTATLPDSLVQMLQWLSDNVMVPDPNNPGQMIKKYSSPQNVILVDAISDLVPKWQSLYIAGQVQALNNQVAQQTATIAGQVQAGLAAITIS